MNKQEVLQLLQSLVSAKAKGRHELSETIAGDLQIEEIVRRQ